MTRANYLLCVITWTILVPIAVGGIVARWGVGSYRRWRSGDGDAVDLLKDVGLGGYMMTTAVMLSAHPIMAGALLLGFGAMGVDEYRREKRRRELRQAKAAQRLGAAAPEENPPNG